MSLFTHCVEAFDEWVEIKKDEARMLKSQEVLGDGKLAKVVLAIRAGKIPDLGTELGAVSRADFSLEAIRRLDLYLGKRKSEWSEFQYFFESIAIKAEKLTPELAYEIWGDFLN